MKKYTNILWGVAFILVGLIVALNVLGITSINIFFDGWWTLFIIVPCFIDLFDGDDLSGSIIGIIIGFILLLCCQDIINFNLIWKLALPAFLVIVGIGIILKSVIRNVPKELQEKNKNDLDVYCATFGEQKVDLSNTKFNGASINSVFGSVDLNLSTSKINENVIIYATSIFGGTVITVPENVKVIVKSIPIFGAVANKRKNPKDDKAKIIYIKGISVFGSIEIK